MEMISVLRRKFLHCGDNFCTAEIISALHVSPVSPVCLVRLVNPVSPVSLVSPVEPCEPAQAPLNPRSRPRTRLPRTSYFFEFARWPRHRSKFKLRKTWQPHKTHPSP